MDTTDVLFNDKLASLTLDVPHSLAVGDLFGQITLFAHQRAISDWASKSPLLPVCITQL